MNPTGFRLAVLVLVVTVLAAVYNNTLPLSGDEAYYWVWSLHLQPGYHDHPPAIAVLIAMTTALVGDTVYGVRLVAVLCMTGALFFTWRMTRQVFGDQAALWALGIGFLLPMTQMGYVMATPDAPLVLFWAAAAAFGLDAVTAPQGRWSDFLLAGLFAGAAMASKYTGVLVPASVFVFVLWRRRDLLVNPRLWASVAVAALVFSPVLWWNYTQGFESFAFQYNHGTGQETAILWSEFGTFVAGQLVVLSPIFAVLLVFAMLALRKGRRDDAQAYLALLFLAPLTLFLYKGLFAKMQLNWAAPAYLTAIPLLAGWIVRQQRQNWAKAGLALALIMAIILRWPVQIGLPPKWNIQNRIFGNEQAVSAISQARRPGDMLFADDLIRAALVQFYVPDHARVMIPTQTRYSEYTRWDQGTDWTQLHGIYLAKDDRLAELVQVFGQAQLEQVFVAMQPGFRQEKFFIYRVGAE